jgi:hypothetical protein
MSFISRVLSVFEDPVGTDRPLWFDVSKWQGVISAEAIKQAGAFGVASRAVVGKDYVDPYFAANWKELEETGLYRASYGVYVPCQLVVDQLDNWYRVCPVRDVIPRVIDLEIQDKTISFKKIADDIWMMKEVIQGRDGVPPLIYSRKNLIEQWLVPYWTEEMINAVYWWLAQYTWNRVVEHAGPPDIPAKLHRENVCMHQTADKKPTPAGVARSKTLDHDRWELGSDEEMRIFIENVWGKMQPIPEPEPGTGLRFECVVDTVNVRAGPGVNHMIVGALHRGDLVDAVDVGGADSWVKIDENHWVCVTKNSKKFLQVVR